MIFTSLEFMLFLPAVWGLFRLTSRRWHRPLLLVASYFFYMSWGPLYGLLLAGVSLSNWFAGWLIHREWRPKHVVTAAVVLNLGVLGFYKYVDFFLQNVAAGAELLGLDGSWMLGRFSVVLPLGISFFTFQGISYTIDVYRDRRQYVASPVDGLLFIAFFPQLIAGPIVRASELVHQLHHLEQPRRDQLVSGAALALRGFFKKAVLADNLSLVVDQAFRLTDQWETGAAWVYMLAYALQIYFDFSGYSDIALGTSRLFGIELSPNFENPYASASITEFWRRWHISLSTWLRDYLYIPLGGNRHGALRQYRNLFLTMLLGGLWHGASWNFVVWGAWHGALLAAHKLYRSLLPRETRDALDASLPWRGVGVALTFAVVLVSWVPFRAQTLGETLLILERMFSFGDLGVPVEVLGSTALVVVLTYLAYRLSRVAVERSALGREVLAWVQSQPPLVLAVLTQVGVCTFTLSPSGASPFIYFQF